MPDQRECPVCQGPTVYWAEAVVLGEIPVHYSRCTACGLVRADDVHWLDHAYSTAIANTDVGLLDRCVSLSHVTAACLHVAGRTTGPFLDWAGGYGVLTRLMRDRGFDFRDHDPMADNLFAGPFRLAELGSQRFQAVTAFEVLEHLTDPVDALRAVADRTDCLLVSTQVLPQPTPRPDEWDYYALDGGQHVTFYSDETLRHLARRLGFSHAAVGSLCHVFHRGQVPRRARLMATAHQVGFVAGMGWWLRDRRRGLTISDAARYRGVD